MEGRLLQQATDQVGVMLSKDCVQLSQQDYDRGRESKKTEYLLPYMLVQYRNTSSFYLC